MELELVRATHVKVNDGVCRVSKKDLRFFWEFLKSPIFLFHVS